MLFICVDEVLDNSAAKTTYTAVLCWCSCPGIHTMCAYLHTPLQGDTIMEQLTEAMAPEEGAATASQLSTQQLVGAVKACAQQLGKRFDSEHGGFGGPPKFPRPSEINILLRAHSQFQVGGVMCGLCAVVCVCVCTCHTIDVSYCDRMLLPASCCMCIHTCIVLKL